MREKESMKISMGNRIRTSGDSYYKRIVVRSEPVKNVTDEICIRERFTDSSKLISNSTHGLEVIIATLPSYGGSLKKMP